MPRFIAASCELTKAAQWLKLAAVAEPARFRESGGA